MCQKKRSCLDWWILPVSADKHDLKLLTRLFDGLIWFHQDPGQTAARRALMEREEGEKGLLKGVKIHYIKKNQVWWVAAAASITLGIFKMSFHVTLDILCQALPMIQSWVLIKLTQRYCGSVKYIASINTLLIDWPLPLLLKISKCSLLQLCCIIVCTIWCQYFFVLVMWAILWWC